MTTLYRERDDHVWPERFRVIAEMTEQASGVRLRNPEALVGNVVCNGCGFVTSGTVDRPPSGWRLGAFGENDYCPSCCSKGGA